VTVLDSQAIVAFLVGEPAAEPAAALLREREPGPCVSAANWSEVLDVLVRVKGRGLDEVTERLDWLLAGGLRVVAVDEAIGRESGRLRAEHYHRDQRPLSLADCIALATARRLGEPLATSDPALAAAAIAVRVSLISLPDSSGQRPTP
jgi:predicted nucleic acid-binding protein